MYTAVHLKGCKPCGRQACLEWFPRAHAPCQGWHCMTCVCVSEILDMCIIKQKGELFMVIGWTYVARRYCFS